MRKTQAEVLRTQAQEAEQSAAREAEYLYPKQIAKQKAADELYQPRKEKIEQDENFVQENPSPTSSGRNLRSDRERKSAAVA